MLYYIVLHCIILRHIIDYSDPEAREARPAERALCDPDSGGGSRAQEDLAHDTYSKLFDHNY